MSKQWPNGAYKILILMMTMLILGVSASQAQQNSQVYLGVQVVVNDQGTQVVQVIPGSPAEIAGIKPGDVIVSINAEALSPGHPLDTILNKLSPNTMAQITIRRNGESIRLTLYLGALPTAAATANTGQTTTTLATSVATASAANTNSGVASPVAPTLAPATASGTAAFLGVRLVDLRQGMQIVMVLPGSPADTAGLKVGDLVLAVDNQPVQLAGQVQAVLNQKAVGASMLIRIQRGAQLQDITVQVGTRPASTSAGSGTITPTPAANGASSGSSFAAGASFPGLGFVVRIEPDGLRVFSLTPGSPADQGGLKTGDLIMQVGTTSVNLLDLTPAIVQLAAQPTSLVVVRGGLTMTIQLAQASGTPDQR